MDDVIRLLPEGLSNQIAAGEVVQRPASVVKELLENAIDAGAKHIQLIVREGGKSLIQVIDNGNGMTPADSRMCFERHATSKIAESDDLFRIKTKGFRGEALAAISSVAQVELKTKTEADELGISVIIEGGKFIAQEPCQFPKGSGFSVKNLFFNVPARRNFLKDDAVELRHIIEEFERVAIPHPEISFSLNSNGNELYQLPASPLLQRITGLLGAHLKEKLVPIQENTPYVNIRGFIGKPDAAVKRRGINYFFVNNRFIRSPYLHTAVMNAYAELIARDLHMYYYVFIDIAPESIDINIHPNKTEIKFEDERTVFMLLQSAAQRALGKAGVGPQIEFNTETAFEPDFTRKNTIPVQPGIRVNTSYNPFKSTSLSSDSFSSSSNTQSEWSNELEQFRQDTSSLSFVDQQQSAELFPSAEKDEKIPLFQLRNKYIVTANEGGLLLIDQQRAHERILYEQYRAGFTSGIPSQQELFPISAEYSVQDYLLLMELKDDLKFLGYELDSLGKNTIAIHGTPADLNGQNAKEILDAVLENYKLNNLEVKTDNRENLCRSLASGTSVKNGKKLEETEMQSIVNRLMQCEQISFTPSGKPILTQIGADEIDKLFRKK